jgi:hypothetical protein
MFSKAVCTSLLVIPERPLADSFQQGPILAESGTGIDTLEQESTLKLPSTNSTSRRCTIHGASLNVFQVMPNYAGTWHM